MDWDDVGAGTQSDVATLQVAAKALALGMPPRCPDANSPRLRRRHRPPGRRHRAHLPQLRPRTLPRPRTHGPDLLAASEAVGKPLLDLVEPTLVYFHRRAYQRANREDLLRHLAEPTTPPSTTPGQEQATVLFVDLASFTPPLTATMGDHAAAEVLRRFGITVRSSAAQHRGRILRRAAGQFLITETSATRPDIIPPQADFTALPPRGDSGEFPIRCVLSKSGSA